MTMVLKTYRCGLIIAFSFFVLFAINECKRGGGRRGGTYRGSSNVWGRAKQSQNGNYDLYGSGQRRSKSQSDGQPVVNQKPDAAPNTNKASAPNTNKASAPPAPTSNDNQKSTGGSSASFIEHEKQQAAPQITAQRPVGWDVGQGAKVDGNVNKKVGWNVGNSNPAYSGTGGLSHPSSGNLGNQPGYPAHAGAYPNTGASSYYGTGTNYNYGNGYHQQHNPNQPSPGYYPTNVGGVGNSPMAGNHYGGGNGAGYVGGNQYGNQGYGGYGGSGGYGGHGGYGGYGGPGGYGGYGGHGGYGGVGGFGGGWGGNGMGGYGKGYGGGFGSGFGKNAFRSAIVGLLVWNLVSGFTRRPYYVYNYYNNPEKIPTDIPLPANTIVLCPDNVTSLCAPNTAALCTSNSTILCVALAQQTVPCDNNSTLKCVNSTVTCTEEPCDKNENKNATSSVNIPCVTNATIIGKIMDNSTIAYSGSGTLFNQGNSESTNLCVTTLALPQPEEEAKQEVQPLCKDNDPSCISNSTDLFQSKDPSLNTTVLNSAISTVTPLAM